MRNRFTDKISSKDKKEEVNMIREEIRELCKNCDGEYTVFGIPIDDLNKKELRLLLCKYLIKELNEIRRMKKEPKIKPVILYEVDADGKWWLRIGNVRFRSSEETAKKYSIGG